MKRSRVTWAALATLGMTLVTPASPALAAPYATCSGSGVVRSIANNLPIRAWHSITSARLDTLQRGDYLDCLSGAVSLGDRYDACGVSRANGWLPVRVADGPTGWTYWTCLVDA
jgi:hypothetical protein